MIMKSESLNGRVCIHAGYANEVLTTSSRQSVVPLAAAHMPGKGTNSKSTAQWCDILAQRRGPCLQNGRP